MRRAARIDTNQPEIVKGLRDRGCVVAHLHTIGRGVPDICVGFGGRNYLFEIKDPTRPLSQRMLTSDEKIWHKMWNEKGRVDIIESVEQAMDIITKDLKK